MTVSDRRVRKAREFLIALIEAKPKRQSVGFEFSSIYRKIMASEVQRKLGSGDLVSA